MLEPSTAAAYGDRCLLAELDLSAVCWVFTANDVAALPRPLLGRMDVIQVGRPGPEHFDLLLDGIEHEIAASWGVPPTDMPTLPVRIVAGLRTMFARHRSVRRLRSDVVRLLSVIVPDRPGVIL